MPSVHRQDDLRACGATTIVSGQSTVKAGGKLVAVVGDKNSHGEGAFTNNGRKVFINGKRVIAVGDSAVGDNALHPAGSTDSSSGISTIKIG